MDSLFFHFAIHFMIPYVISLCGILFLINHAFTRSIEFTIHEQHQMTPQRPWYFFQFKYRQYLERQLVYLGLIVIGYTLFRTYHSYHMSGSSSKDIYFKHAAAGVQHLFLIINGTLLITLTALIKVLLKSKINLILLGTIAGMTPIFFYMSNLVSYFQKRTGFLIYEKLIEIDYHTHSVYIDLIPFLMCMILLVISGFVFQKFKTISFYNFNFQR